MSAVTTGISLFRANSLSVIDGSESSDSSHMSIQDVPRISIGETEERFESGMAVIVDVRSVQEYYVAHIPGALSIPLNELQYRHQELPRDTEIITYCT